MILEPAASRVELVERMWAEFQKRGEGGKEGEDICISFPLARLHLGGVGDLYPP